MRCGLVAAGGHAVYTRRFATSDATSRLPIVLVPGFLVSGRYMLPSARLLAERFDVVVPDPPGHGESGKPANALTVPEYADVLASWAETLGLRRAIYVGHSFGCQMVAALAVRHPDLVSAVVLAAPTVDPTPRSVPQLAVRLALDFLHERPSLIPTEWSDLWDMGLKYFLGELHSMLEDRIADRLPSIEQPVLFVRGCLDPIAPASWVDRAAHLIPHAAVLDVPNAPHAANYSTPHQFVDAVLPFLLEHGHV